MDILDQIIGEELVSQSIGIQPIHIRFSTNVNSDSSTLLTKNLLYSPTKKDDENEEENNKQSENRIRVDNS